MSMWTLNHMLRSNDYETKINKTIGRLMCELVWETIKQEVNWINNLIDHYKSYLTQIVNLGN